jgi:D-beta-D-heptose 7-phosphate kinase / D-beta-D-heptose 1-phosphate adenosyltransferase
MTPRPLVIVGDTLLDVDVDGDVERLCPEAPVPVLDEADRVYRPGGAGLAATLAAADGRTAALVTALANDEGGRQLRALLEGAGIEVVDLGLAGTTPRKVRLRADGRLLLRVDRGDGGAPRAADPPERARRLVETAGAVLVADYGRGVAAAPGLRRALAEAAAARPVVWDPHPLGAEPVPGLQLVTPNRREVAGLVPAIEGRGFAADAARAQALARRFASAAVAVTLGAEGALLVVGDAPPLAVPAVPVAAADVCGAGDRFASAVAGALADGALLPDAVAEAVRIASAFVEDGGAGSVRVERADRPVGRPRRESAEEVVERVRAAGGTVVMTGGCFDLLHAGHIRTLQAARELGDCLVVCVNSDDSVRRLKGGDRPLVPEDDRAAVLSALACVDGVVVFDEDTPEAVLERFQPDLFAKGGDYALEELPEARALARWGGEVVILPYFEGRSTSRLIEELLVRAV